MRRTVVSALFLIVLTACSEKPSWQVKPLSEAGEKVYPLHGSIVSRDVASNTVMVKHEKIEGLMEAMTMDFSVRGVAVGSLPPDGSPIEASLHVIEGAYWLTDIRARKS